MLLKSLKNILLNFFLLFLSVTAATAAAATLHTPPPPQQRQQQQQQQQHTEKQAAAVPRTAASPALFFYRMLPPLNHKCYWHCGCDFEVFHKPTLELPVTLHSNHITKLAFSNPPQHTMLLCVTCAVVLRYFEGGLRDLRKQSAW